MDTETHLCLTTQQTKLLITELQSACKDANATQEIKHVRVVCEQAKHKGPWRLILTICPEEEG
jgi:hypothetical protein